MFCRKIYESSHIFESTWYENQGFNQFWYADIPLSTTSILMVLFANLYLKLELFLDGKNLNESTLFFLM